MKAKELAERLLEYPDFELNFTFGERDNSEWGYTVRKFSIINMGIDIGHSDKIFSFGGDEQE